MIEIRVFGKKSTTEYTEDTEFFSQRSLRSAFGAASQTTVKSNVWFRQVSSLGG